MTSSRPLFTTSWDDGHPLDLRLATLLQRHGFGGTFYVPLSNREGLPVLSRAQIRDLAAAGFEIGSHTLTHCYLTSVDAATALDQITRGKAELEDILGAPVPGFCYPGGKFRREHRAMVKAAGFTYARTTANLYGDILDDAYAMPVTIQTYPHSSGVYLRNFLRHGQWARRRSQLQTALTRDFGDRLKRSLDSVCARNGVFHLWGHSWELDAIDGWRVLDDFLAYAAGRIETRDRLSNQDVLCRRLVLP